jgi:hypothetical protein
MTLFQLAALALLSLAGVRELLRLRRGLASRRGALLRLCVVGAAAGAIARPDWTNQFAHALGIGRGADVVLYLFALAFIAAAFGFYARTVRLERQVTALVGKLAQLEAQRGPAPAEGEPGPQREHQ